MLKLDRNRNFGTIQGIFEDQTLAVTEQDGIFFDNNDNACLNQEVKIEEVQERLRAAGLSNQQSEIDDLKAQLAEMRAEMRAGAKAANAPQPVGIAPMPESEPEPEPEPEDDDGYDKRLADLMNMAPAKIAKLARQLIETGVDIEVATGKGSKLVNAKAVAANTG